MGKQKETRLLIPTETSQSAKQELQQFPYVRGAETKEKQQYMPDYRWQIYHDHGQIIKGSEQIAEGYRFDTHKVTMLKQDGSEYCHTVTLSKPSVEVICLKKDMIAHQVYVYLVLQSRTPYIATVPKGNTMVNYARFFLEEPAGLVEYGETFEEAAKREVEEETGYQVEKLVPLIVPAICRHVSYSDETSQVFVAKLGKKIGQRLDQNENCMVGEFTIEELEKEFEDYLEGRKSRFYDFDLSEMTIMSLQRFFVKWHREDFVGFFAY